MKDTKPELKFGEWAKYAEEDRTIAELAIRGDGPPNQICFHSQQIAFALRIKEFVLQKIKR